MFNFLFSRWAANISLCHDHRDHQCIILFRIKSSFNKRFALRKASKLGWFFLFKFYSVYLKIVKEYTHLMWHSICTWN